MNNEIQAQAYGIARRSFARRLWWKIGYGMHQSPPSIDDDLEARKMPGWFLTNVFIQFSFGDRVRLLLTGKVKVRLECRASAVVDDVKSVSSIELIAPGE